MELMEGLLSRRSVRQYTDKQVDERDIIEIVKAGMYAPSARNQQLWRFIVITDKDKLAHFSEGLPSASMAKNAAFAVAVCADPAMAVSPDYWEQDCSAAIENMMLAAFAKGIGTVWVGMHPNETKENVVRRECDIPENIKVHSLMIGGYPAAELPKVDRFRPEFIHQNKWDG